MLRIVSWLESKMQATLKTFFLPPTMRGMDKNTVIEIFGGIPALARELGISQQAVYEWPDRLSERQEDRIIRLAWRTNRLPDIEQMITPPT